MENNKISLRNSLESYPNEGGFLIDKTPKFQYEFADR